MDPIFELKQQMLFLESAHASAGMGHFILDPRRQVIEFSSWVRDNVGLNDIPIPLERLPEMVPEEDRAQFTETFTRIIKEEVEFAFEANIIAADGCANIQLVSGIPAFEDPAAKSGLIGFYGIVQDVSGAKRAQRDLIAARDKAESELEARSTILATVSHEIRTPLGGILGIIDQLKREQSATERDRAIGLMEDSCLALLETLDAVLQQARLSKGETARTEKSFRPSAIAQRVAELFRPVARRKAIAIELNSTSDSQVVGDPGRIQQVLANFVSNAVKFTQSGKVTIFVQHPVDGQQDWAFVVSDTGVGMDQKRLSTIFELYDTSGEDSLGRSVGSGLGLSITLEIVESMSGRIEVESEVGRGSSFSFFLPLAAVDDEIGDEIAESGKGTICLLVEKATEQIQIEAIASQRGWVCLDANTVATDAEGPIIIVVDQSNIASVPENLASLSERVLVLSSSMDEQKIPENIAGKSTIIDAANASRMLPAWLEELD